MLRVTNRNIHKLFFLVINLLLTILPAGTILAQRVNTLPDWALGGFVRPKGLNPIISPDSTTSFVDPISNTRIHWESNDTFNPAAVVKDGRIILLYRAEDKSGVKIGKRTSRIGFAISSDGVNFIRNSEPVLYPSTDDQREFEWTGGCEDPRAAITENGTYVIFYTQWNKKTPRLGVATSRDLIHWTKHGPIFRDAYNGKFHEMATKSASILTTIKKNKQVITKVNGKYFMYWGERHVYAATSENLLDWTPLVDQQGKLLILASPRNGYFDSDMTECGPPALLTKKGIVLIYNGRNRTDDRGDKRFYGGSYSGGQFLFDKTDPTKLKDRLNVPFFRPMELFEKKGQYSAGTVFIEGLAWFQKKWYLYYGCADSRVGVAVFNPSERVAADPVSNEAGK